MVVNQNNSIALQKDNTNLSIEPYKSSKKKHIFCFAGNMGKKSVEDTHKTGYDSTDKKTLLFFLLKGRQKCNFITDYAL